MLKVITEILSLEKSVTGKLHKPQLEKKEYWDNFLRDIEQLNNEDLETKYTRECYMNSAKIAQWKLSLMKLINAWDGDLKELLDMVTNRNR